ncbi:MAG: hypothetical protein H6686_09955 [Fibrobacteria bacterium]|nr:hypothetical protein [Fibrobacteria bacterium]
MRGAGGTRGGVESFLLGLSMMFAGGYLLLQSIKVTTVFSMGYGLYRFGGMTLTSGMVLIPMFLGVAMIFWNARNWLGWVLALGSLIALIAGVIASVQFHIIHMSLFEFLVILVLAVGGTALFARSLMDSPPKGQKS